MKSLRFAFAFGALGLSALSFSTDVSVNFSQYYTSYESSNPYSNVGSIDIDKKQEDAFGYAKTSGTVAPGLIKLKVESHLEQGTTPLYNYAGQYVTGTFGDEVIPTGGSVGTSGKLTPVVNLSGLLSASSSALSNPEDYPSASYGLSIVLSRFPNRQTAGANGQFIGGVFTGDALPKSFTPEFDIIFGESYYLSVSLSVSTQTRLDPANNSGWWSTASSDFSHTVQWGGASAKDQFGAPVSGFSLVGSGGNNWAQPVPEPSSMIALALGGLAVLRRR
ncbi:MAG: PEP-CTERM sorting domain-containing protein, partial [Fimbriimonas sp.]